MISTIQNVFREVFNNPDLVIHPQSGANEIAEWDSFNHVVLMATFEELYGITFSVDEIVTLTSVERIIAALQEKGVQLSV